MARERRVWLEEYKCGCTFVGFWRDLVGYCAKHGEQRRGRPRNLGKESQNRAIMKGLA